VSEFWTPIYMEHVQAVVERLFRPHEQNDALAIIWQMLRRVNRASDNGLYGSCYIGRSELAVTSKTTERRVRTTIKRLINAHQLTSCSTNRGTVLTFTDIDAYIYRRPADDQADDQQVTSERPASDQQVTSRTPESDHYLDKERKKERDIDNSASPEQAEPKPEKPAAPRWQADLVFVRWNDLHADFPAMLRHEELTEDRERAILQAMRTYGGANVVLRAVENYAQVLDGAEYRWNHAYTIEDFMRRGVSKFLDEARPLENFLVRSADAQADSKREAERQELSAARQRLCERIEELRANVDAGTAPPGDLTAVKNQLARVEERLAKLAKG